MSNSIPNLMPFCKALIDQMDRSAQGWHDEVQKSYYDRRLYPLIATAADYQSKVSDYMRLLNDYNRRIAELADLSPTGFGIGEHELYRQQIDPNILAQLINRLK